MHMNDIPLFFINNPSLDDTNMFESSAYKVGPHPLLQERNIIYVHNEKERNQNTLLWNTHTNHFKESYIFPLVLIMTTKK